MDFGAHIVTIQIPKREEETPMEEATGAQISLQVR